MTNLARVGIVTLAVAVGTWALGWLAVPAIALVAGLARWRPFDVTVGCAFGWGALFIIAVSAGNLGRVGGLLAGIVGIPAAALIIVTIVFPSLLGWSAASVGYALRGFSTTSRQPS